VKPTTTITKTTTRTATARRRGMELRWHRLLQMNDPIAFHIENTLPRPRFMARWSQRVTNH